MNVFTILKNIIDNIVTLMSSYNVYGNVTWWHVFVSFMALSLGIYLFKLLFIGRGDKK